MGRPRKLRWPVALAIIGLTSPSGAETAASSESIHESEPVSCWRLASVPGPEDLVVDRSRNRLLVSSQNRRGKPLAPGGIFAIPLDSGASPGPQPLRLVGRDDCSFHPHGISLVKHTSGSWLLYVINHHEPNDTSPSKSCLPGGELLARHGSGFTSIEAFKVERNGLRFLQRLADPTILANGNDLVALESGDLFITSPPTGLVGLVRDLLTDQGASEVVQFECSKGNDVPCSGRFRSVAKIGRYANGIEARRLDDGRQMIYVASSLESVLYEIEVGGSGKPRRIEVPKGFDNLAWKTDQRSVLLAAAHPNMRRFLQHARTPEAPSPSQVWEIDVGVTTTTKLLLLDEGSLISAASTAVCVDGDLVLGQVFESAVLRCRGLCRAETEVTP